MQNKRLVRIQLAVLAGLTILVLARVFIGQGEPEGVVVMTDLDKGELKVSSIHLDHAEPFLLDATGSLQDKYDATRPFPEFAAYPWIINRDTRSIVWQMEPANVQVETNTVVHASTTLTLEPGDYDIFFTSFGNSRESRRGGNIFRTLTGTHWTADKDQWTLILRSTKDDGSSAVVTSVDDRMVLAPAGKGLVWTSAPMKGYSKAHYVFSVESPTELRAYSIGELCHREECDVGWIEEVFSGRKIWELKELNSHYAGGMKENRVSDVTLDVAPGIYRAVFKTDARHAWGDWIANPPFDPGAWGLTVYEAGEQDGAVVPFDPWTQLEPVVSIRSVGNSERRQAQFEVREPVDLVLHATGEITGSGSLYDYAWLRNDANQEKVWEMSWSESYPAGGASKNRQEMAFVHVAPGAYSLFYETDDSHAFDSWNSARPDYPERWGVTAFVFGDKSAVRVQGPVSTIPPTPPVPRQPAVAPVDLPPLGKGKKVVDARKLGNESAVENTFSIASSSRIRIQATGEISMSGRYDYAWIERADGTTVWEMTYDNTVPAGGDDANRKFDGVIELPAGSYVLRFKTDFSHAYGDFGHDGPADPGAWGVVAEILP